MSATINTTQQDKRRWLIGYVREAFSDPTIQNILARNYSKPTDSDTWLWDVMVFCVIDNTKKTPKSLIRKYELLDKLPYKKMVAMCEDERREYIFEEYSKISTCDVPAAYKTLSRTLIRLMDKGPSRYKHQLLSLPMDQRIFEISTIWGVDNHNAISIIEDADIPVDYVDDEFLIKLTGHFIPAQLKERKDARALYSVLANIAGMNSEHFMKIISTNQDQISHFMELSQNPPSIPIIEPKIETNTSALPQKKPVIRKESKKLNLA